MAQMTWTEKVTADYELDRLVELFEAHNAGKVNSLLVEYLADNPDEDDVKAILATLREEDPTVAVDYSDIEEQ